MAIVQTLTGSRVRGGREREREGERERGREGGRERGRERRGREGEKFV